MDALDALIDLAEGREPVNTTASNEDLFVHNLTVGSAPKIANLIHFVRHQVYILDHFHTHGVHIMKETYNNATFNTDLKRASWRDQIAVLIEYYLLMHHRVPFEVGSGAPQCDLKSTVQKLMDHSAVKTAVNRLSAP